MKYLYYIVLAVVVVSAAAGYVLKPVGTPQRKAAVIINDRVISAEEFSRLYAALPPHIKRDRDDFINSLIIKELLIQESRKGGIDKEETFRRSIQDYYEQSLIKLLMDRKIAFLNVSVSDDELNRYISYLNKKILLSIFTFEDLDKAKRGQYTRVEQKTSFFEDLSNDLKTEIIHLKKGEMSQPAKSGDFYIAFRIDNIDSLTSPAPSKEERERIRQVLIEKKKEEAVDNWLADLRSKARITILVGTESGGNR